MKSVSIEIIKKNKILGPLFKHAKDLPSNFFKIPRHDYQVLATTLYSSRYEDLDFTDPDLVYKLYAVALESTQPLTENMIVTGLMLTWAHQSFYAPEYKTHPFLRKYAFDDKSGPYQVDTISYITSEQSQLFKQQNKEIKDGGYYRINLPRKWTAAFLYDGLADLLVYGFPNSRIKEKFGLFLKAYFYRWKRSSTADTILTETQFILHMEKLKPDFIDIFKQFIEYREPDFVKFLQIKAYSQGIEEGIKVQRENIIFLHKLLALDEQTPSIEISPEFDEKDSTTPLLCMVNLTVTSAIQLQSIIHGKDTTFPLFVASPPPLSLFAETLCNPEFFAKSECRPVELSYRGIKRAEEYHSFKIDSYFAMWHDFLFHCFRNGANPHKPLIRYLVKFLQTLKGYVMSSWIWTLCDMDTNGGLIYRKNLQALNLKNLAGKEHKDELMREKMLALNDTFCLLKQSGSLSMGRFFEYLDKNDTVLAILFDMNKNGELLQPLLGGHPSKDIFTKANPFLSILCGDKNHKKFLPIFNKVKQIADSNTEKSIEYCILAYRLHQYPVCWSLFNDLLGAFDLKNILKWDRNQGLYFRDLKSNAKYELENMKNPLEFLEHFASVLTLHQEFKNTEVIEKTKKLNLEIAHTKKRPPALELEKTITAEEDTPILSGTPIRPINPPIKPRARCAFFHDDMDLKPSLSRPPALVRSKSCPTLM